MPQSPLVLLNAATTTDFGPVFELDEREYRMTLWLTGTADVPNSTYFIELQGAESTSGPWQSEGQFQISGFTGPAVAKAHVFNPGHIIPFLRARISAPAPTTGSLSAKAYFE